MRPDNLRSNDPRHSLLKAPTAELCFNKCDHKCSKRAISRDFGLLDAGLRMINQEVKKMLDLSERILAKKWGVQTTHQRVLTRKRFHIRRRPSVPNEARTTRRLEFEPEELWPIRKGRCRSAAPDLIRRQHSTDHYGSYAERQNFWELDQTAQHNSALINEPNQSEVRWSHSSKRSVHHRDCLLSSENRQSTKIGSQNFKMRLSEQDSKKRRMTAPERKSTLKMRTTPNGTGHLSLGHTTEKNSQTLEGDTVKKATDRDEPILEKLILELDDMDYDDDENNGIPNVPSKTTVQFRFRTPSVHDVKKDEFSPRKSVNVEERHDSENTLNRRENRKPSSTSQHSARQSTTNVNPATHRPSRVQLNDPSKKEETHTSKPNSVSASLFSSRSRPLSHPRESRTQACQCTRADRGSKTWYDPILCNCVYEHEAERVSSLQDKNSQKPSRRNTIVSVNRKEEGQDETHHTLEPPDLMPRSPASTTWAKLSPERTISMDTLEILGAIERPDTIENLSRRQLEKEIHRSPSPINATTRPHRKETSKPLPNQEIAPVTQSAEPLTPASSSPNQTTYIVPIAYPSILYYPVAQPTTYTDFRSQAGVPPISANGVLVQSNPTSIMPVQQLCPPPIVYGSCVTPTLSPPVFQQTVFLPSTFHLLSYQAL